MSSLQYFAYEGKGKINRAQYGYSQAVRVGDRIECAGQGKESRATYTGSFLLLRRIRMDFKRSR